MKKLLFLLLSGGFFIANAQQNYQIGAKVGYLHSELYYSLFKSVENTQPMHMIYLAFQGEYRFLPKLSVQGEITFTSVGGKEVGLAFPISGESIYDAFSVRSHLTSLPISLKYYPHPRVALLTGIQLSYAPKAFAQKKDNAIRITNANCFQQHLFIGTEVHFLKNAFVELRYNVGVAPFLNASPTFKTHFFQIGIGVHSF